MDLTISTINDDLISSARLKLNRVTENISKYTVFEQSEAFEVAGICQYFNGQFREAMVNLDISIKKPYENIKPPRQVCYIKILVGNSSIYTDFEYVTFDLLYSWGQYITVSEIWRKQNPT